MCVIVLASSSFPSTTHSRYKLSRTNKIPRDGSLTLEPNNYSVQYYQQRLDHFNAADQRTFKQRYLVNKEKWEGKGPILLYTGNEGDITWFCNNTVSGLGRRTLVWGWVGVPWCGLGRRTLLCVGSA